MGVRRTREKGSRATADFNFRFASRSNEVVFCVRFIFRIFELCIFRLRVIQGWGNFYRYPFNVWCDKSRSFYSFRWFRITSITRIDIVMHDNFYGLTSPVPISRAIFSCIRLNRLFKHLNTRAGRKSGTYKTITWGGKVIFSYLKLLKKKKISKSKQPWVDEWDFSAVSRQFARCPRFSIQMRRLPMALGRWKTGDFDWGRRSRRRMRGKTKKRKAKKQKWMWGRFWATFAPKNVFKLFPDFPCNKVVSRWETQ